MRIVAGLILVATLSAAPQFTQGTLRRVNNTGQEVGDCPLKRTSVTADIAGMLARVTVVQQFQNTYNEAIEAIYVFPLPSDGSVDRMTMTVAGRTIKGSVRKRDEARAMYDAAKQAGKLASLLDQERPNVFTQSLTNIPPGETVHITISYVEVIQYEAGDYQFVFPMVVGPRYNPAGLRDASRVSPPIAAEGTRPGHDITIAVQIDAGIPLGTVDSKSHTIEVHRVGATRAEIKLRDQAVIPNKDFILRYDGSGQTIQNAVLTHRSSKEGFFTLVLQPPERALAADIAPKELIFVLDTSGSMMGQPIEKAKEAMKLALGALRPNDTFNVITFAGDTEILFPAPVAATPENLQIAGLFLTSRSGRGGTEMMKAIRAALAGSGESGRVRIVCFMTDGYVGNDMEIIAEIQKHPQARVFGFGIGSSVNRFLLDRMSSEGRGDVEYVALNDNANAAVKRFEQRIREPLLTDITIDWAGMPVADVYPLRIPDLFSAKPVIITGRYTNPSKGTIRMRGTSGGRVITRDIPIDLPASSPSHDSLATLWARRHVSSLMRRDYAGSQRGAMAEVLKSEIEQTGVAYGIMTQFTSFIAVEERRVTTGGRVKTIEVPVSMPEGVKHEGIFGGGSGSGSGGGVYRIGGGVVGGIVAGVPSVAPPQPRSVTMALEVPKASDGTELKISSGLRTHLEKPDAVSVQVLLTDASTATLDALRRTGFQVSRAPGRDLLIRGRIAGNKLRELARLAQVRFVVALPPAR